MDANLRLATDVRVDGPGHSIGELTRDLGATDRLAARGEVVDPKRFDAGGRAG